jgi:hypothetical protein
VMVDPSFPYTTCEDSSEIGAFSVH